MNGLSKVHIQRYPLLTRLSKVNLFVMYHLKRRYHSKYTKMNKNTT